MHNEMSLLPWSPLAGGFLAGKYERRQKPPANSRAASDKPLYQSVSAEYAALERNWATIDAVTQVAQDLGASPAQVALSWLRNRPGVTAPIFGARTIEHLKDALGAIDLELDPAVTGALDEVSVPAPGGYPYGTFGKEQVRRPLNPSDPSPGQSASEGSAHPTGQGNRN